MAYVLIAVPTTNNNEYLLVSFNLSRANSNDRLHSSELRVYKDSVSQATLDSLTSPLCDLNDEVDFALFASADGTDTNMSFMKTVTLTHQDLLESKWIRFSNISDLCARWMETTGVNLENMTIKLEFLGGCAGINPLQLGFLTQINEEPMLLAFLETINKTQTYYLRQALSKRDIERRDIEKRQSPEDPCDLQSHVVSQPYINCGTH